MDRIEILERLKQILDLEITYPPVMISISFLIMQSDLKGIPVLVIIFIVVAKLAIPFIIYVLLKERKYFWIASLFLFIVIPALITYLIIKDSVFSKFFLLIPYILFYFYCLLLKFSVRDWLMEAEAKSERENQLLIKEK